MDLLFQVDFLEDFRKVYDVLKKKSIISSVDEKGFKIYSDGEDRNEKMDLRH